MKPSTFLVDTYMYSNKLNFQHFTVYSCDEKIDLCATVYAYAYVVVTARGNGQDESGVEHEDEREIDNYVIPVRFDRLKRRLE